MLSWLVLHAVAGTARHHGHRLRCATQKQLLALPPHLRDDPRTLEGFTGCIEKMKEAANLIYEEQRDIIQFELMRPHMVKA